MVYLLLLVRQGDQILEFAAFDRNMAKVQFDETVVGIALRRDSCLRMRQVLVIKSVPVYVDPENPQTKPGRVLVPQMEQETATTNNQCRSPFNTSGEECVICMNELSFMHLNVEYRTLVKLPANVACSCFQEFTRSDVFRRNCVHFFEDCATWKDMRRRLCRCLAFHSVIDHSVTVAFMIEITAKNFVPAVSYAWCGRLLGLVRKREQLEETMAWLSTLGGGFSSLGDYFLSFSEKAGKLSMTQLQVAVEMGDPIMAAKCRLFYALSLMQRGSLKDSKMIIRAVHYFATHFKVHDQKLIDMCQGIWSKLRYTYHQRARGRSNGYRGNQEKCSDRVKTVDVRKRKLEASDDWVMLNPTSTISTQTDQIHFDHCCHGDRSFDEMKDCTR